MKLRKTFILQGELDKGTPITSHCINWAVNNNLWKPVHFSRNGPGISHLFFIDDLILFFEASMFQVDVIKNCLDIFSRVSGQKVNYSKTRVFFSRNVNHTRREQLCEHLNFSPTVDLGKYLGVPLHIKHVSKQMYKFIVDKLNKRLSGWKSKICLTWQEGRLL